MVYLLAALSYFVQMGTLTFRIALAKLPSLCCCARCICLESRARCLTTLFLEAEGDREAARALDSIRQ
jgi:hypothetical protein